MSDMNNYDDNNDEFDFLEYFFILLSFRRLIFLIFTTISVIGIISYYYSSIIYTTNATLLVDKDQTDPSSFISNNEFEFINDISLENEDQISLFKSTSILNNVIEQTGINYKHYSKKRFKLKTLLNVESLPFVFSFKSEGNQNKAEIDINKNYVKVKINDGSDNVELFQINISSNAITSTMSVTGTISETDPNALPLAIALG